MTKQQRREKFLKEHLDYEWRNTSKKYPFLTIHEYKTVGWLKRKGKRWFKKNYIEIFNKIIKNKNMKKISDKPVTTEETFFNESVQRSARRTIENVNSQAEIYAELYVSSTLGLTNENENKEVIKEQYKVAFIEEVLRKINHY